MVSARMSDWMPIESAPKDGRDVLLGYRLGPRWIVVAAHWTAYRFGYDNRQSERGTWYVVKGGGKTVFRDEAKHWMPLPEPPTQ